MVICLVINGPSSVGKSTLVTGVQDQSALPLLRFGVDELYRMVPSPWAGGTEDARHADRGFSYAEDEADAGEVGSSRRRLINGVDAVRMLRAMNAGVLGMVQAGHDVVVDGQAYQPDVSAELQQQLRWLARTGAIECSILELTADTTTLSGRQRLHAHPVGLAISQSRQGWICPDPDLHLETTGNDVDQVLVAAWQFLVARHPALTAT